MTRIFSLAAVFGVALALPALAQNGPVSTTGHVARTTVHTSGHVASTTVRTAGHVTTGVVGTAGSVANGVTGAVAHIIP
jgi:hypothetical protein